MNSPMYKHSEELLGGHRTAEFPKTWKLAVEDDPRPLKQNMGKPEGGRHEKVKIRNYHISTFPV